MNKKVLLVILDGWGIAKNPKVSAIDAAQTPYINSLYRTYPHSKLEASGFSAAVREGQPATSKLGHVNLDPGRAVNQDRQGRRKGFEQRDWDQTPGCFRGLAIAKAI